MVCNVLISPFSSTLSRGPETLWVPGFTCESSPLSCRTVAFLILGGASLACILIEKAIAHVDHCLLQDGAFFFEVGILLGESEGLGRWSSHLALTLSGLGDTSALPAVSRSSGLAELRVSGSHRSCTLGDLIEYLQAMLERPSKPTTGTSRNPLQHYPGAVHLATRFPFHRPVLSNREG